MVTYFPLHLLREISGGDANGVKGARERILLDRHSCSAVYQMCYRNFGGDLRLRKSIVKFGEMRCADLRLVNETVRMYSLLGAFAEKNRSGR